jgi:hypothetical protein
MTASSALRAPEPRQRTGSRAGRGAAERRRVRSAGLRNRAVVRLVAVIAAATAAVVLYLGLMSNVTRLSFELAHANRDRTHLIEETARLDDQIAHLESRERLAALAQSLGMRDPSTFAVATLRPQPVEKPSGLAFFPAVAHWLR